MDNLVSGSIIEPRITVPAQPKANKSKSLLIAIIIEAVVIVGLIIALISVIISNKIESGYFDEEEIGYLDEEPVYLLEKEDANVLMYMHAIANNSTFSNTVIPSSVCSDLQNIYNSFPNGDSSMASSPCQNQQITIFSIDESDSDLAARGVLHIGIVMGSQSYNYYIYSDFSAIEYLSEDNEIPTTPLTLNVGV